MKCTTSPYSCACMYHLYLWLYIQPGWFLVLGIWFTYVLPCHVFFWNTQLLPCWYLYSHQISLVWFQICVLRTPHIFLWNLVLKSLDLPDSCCFCLQKNCTLAMVILQMCFSFHQWYLACYFLMLMIMLSRSLFNPVFPPCSLMLVQSLTFLIILQLCWIHR